MSWRVRVQADDFFEAYQVLNKHEGGTMCPMVVCLAFALELYIKDIYYAVNIEKALPRGRSGHNILKLYKGLPTEVRQEIFNHKAISQNPFATRGNIFSPKLYSEDYSPYERFLDQIGSISDSFEKWRYAYESQVLEYNDWFAVALIEAVKSVADATRTRPAA